MRPDWAFLFCGIYGVALCLLIASWHVTPSGIRLFVGREYTLGSHGQIWANWHAVGCFFVGIVNLQVYFGDFNPAAMRSIAIATTIIYGVWALQNLRLVFAKPHRFTNVMWLHVLLCAFAAAAIGRLAVRTML